MKKPTWQTLLIVTLLAVSGVLYCLQIVLFRSPRDTCFYLLQDLAFVPLQVLLVTLVLNKLLVDRERSVMLKKLNMAIGLFFSEVGSTLLKNCTEFDAKFHSIEEGFNVCGDFTGDAFEAMVRRISTYECRIEGRGRILPTCGPFYWSSGGSCLPCWRTRTCWSMNHSPSCFGRYFI